MDCFAALAISRYSFAFSRRIASVVCSPEERSDAFRMPYLPLASWIKVTISTSVAAATASTINKVNA